MTTLCALGLRAVFGLTLRQTQGFLHDLTRLLGLEIIVPHFSTFSRRTARLTVPELAGPAGGPLHLAADATGLKWKVRVHGTGKRRVWPKLHLAADTQTGALCAHALTASEVRDGAELEGLLAAVAAPIATVCAGKAYDSFDCHAAILARDPPSRDRATAATLPSSICSCSMISPGGHNALVPLSLAPEIIRQADQLHRM